MIKSSQKLDKSIFFEIKYETIVANPAQSLVNIGNFIGLSWSESDLEEAVYNNSLEVARKTGGTEIPVGGLVACDSFSVKLLDTCQEEDRYQGYISPENL